jgi:ferredoxin
MSIGNRQIGWSQEDNLLWEISKQLDRMNSILCTGPCPTTTTTTTTFIPPGAVPIPVLVGYQTISPVEDIVVSFTLEDTCLFFYNTAISNVNLDSLVLDSTTYYFNEGTLMLYNSVTNTFAEDGYYVFDAILYVTNGLVEILTFEDFVELCNFTTTTTTTTIPLVFTDSLFQQCSADCGDACPSGFPIYYNVWMTQECIDSWPSIGCEIWYDQDRTVPFPDGLYNIGSFMGCIVVTDGVITDVPS